MKPLLAGEAQGLMFHYMQRLFRDRLDRVKAARFDPALGAVGRQAIITLSDDPEAGLDQFAENVQRYLYEHFTQALFFLMNMPPDSPLPELVDDCMTDSEKLSNLLRNGIARLTLEAQPPALH